MKENIVIIKSETGRSVVTDNEKTISLFKSNTIPTAFDASHPIADVKAWIEACNPFANVTVG